MRFPEIPFPDPETRINAVFPMFRTDEPLHVEIRRTERECGRAPACRHNGPLYELRAPVQETRHPSLECLDKCVTARRRREPAIRRQALETGAACEGPRHRKNRNRRSFKPAGVTGPTNIPFSTVLGSCRVTQTSQYNLALS